VLQQQVIRPVGEGDEFGMLIFTWRGTVKRPRVLAHLPGWSKDTFHRLEKGEIAPAFDQLRPLYRALWLAGVALPPDAPQTFVKFARARIAGKRTHLDQHSDEEWEELCSDLTRMDSAFRAGAALGRPVSQSLALNPLLLDTSHLIGRNAWREEMWHLLNGPDRKKVIIIGGPSGIGKTSEMNRLATQLLRRNTHRPILCDLRSAEGVLGPEEALHVFIGTVLSALGYPQQVPPTSLEEQVMTLLEQVEKSLHPVVMFLDHAESILGGQGKLAPCWERFLARVLRFQHGATLVLATQQWPGWFGGELRFVSETTIPPLPREQGVLLLQQLGLATVPLPLLQEIYEKVGGIPICLEWVAALAKQPFIANMGAESERFTTQTDGPATAPDPVSGVQRLLAEPYIFGGALAEEIAPLLEQVLSHNHLSPEAQRLLQIVSLATVPLAKPALDVLAVQWPRVVKELQRASLLVAYPDRVQALPAVAAAVVRALPHEERLFQEEALLEGYQAWLLEGVFYENEKGLVITELVTLLLTHRYLLPAAQVLVRYGWLAFNMGHAVRIARLARAVLEEWERGHAGTPRDLADECGGWLLHYLLGPYLGEKVNRAARAADYQRLLELSIARAVPVWAHTELFVVRHLLFFAMEQRRWSFAQALVDACEQRLAPLIQADPDLLSSLLEKQGYLFTNWCEYAEEQGDSQLAQELREQAIAIYRRSNALLREAEGRTTPLKSSILKKRLAKALTNLGFHLNRVGQFEEAKVVLGQSIALKEQGYTDTGSLPASYGELSQALAAQGQFEEALHYDELALAMIQRQADSGDTVSQETAWIYRVNRGRLYWMVGRVDEAVRLLLEALPHIPERWAMYRMFARQSLQEIGLQREQRGEPLPQYDTRWIGDYREAVAFDSFAMLSPTRFVSEGERSEWARLFPRRGDPAVKKRLETMLAEGKQRELLAAIREGRQPQFSYPAIPLEEVRERLRTLRALAEDIRQQEANAVVRRLYVGDQQTGGKGAIPYQVHFLQGIEATALGNNEAFWQHMCAISPPPTPDEMRFALARVKWFIMRGAECEHSAAVSRRLTRFLEEHLGLAPGDLPDTEEIRPAPAFDVSLYGQPSSALAQRQVPPETARNFFAALFKEQGCQGWEALIDYAARNTRVEPGLRHYILAGIPYSIGKLVELVAHEWEGHVAPRVAGERSLLGLLGIGTGWSLTTEEGLGLFYEMELARRTGQRFDEAKVWLGTLATGLAAGVLVPPQTFLSLYTFLADFLLLYRLIFLGMEDLEVARAKASTVAQTRCLRTFRGVPNLSRPGVCYPKDAVYQRGLFRVYEAVATDRTVLDWLAAGVVALEQIADLQALAIPPAPHAARGLLEQPDLEAYILSFAGESEAPAPGGEG
jgi:tetratricopeptide (TPR) repeat protein